jgi:polyisoprenoid-binding protein YceI
MRHLALIALTALSALPALAQEPPPPAGEYTLDLGHTRVLFGVSHLGFSTYTALFTQAEATLQFDPANPAAMTLTASVDAASIETHYPDPATDFNALLRGADFLDAAAHPKITFVSTAVQLTGENTADVTGDFTLKGVTRPVTLAVTYNGGWADMALDVGARIGFSATGTINRSEFGMGYGIPAPGTTMGVGDAVAITIEAEFSRPRDAAAPAP